MKQNNKLLLLIGLIVIVLIAQNGKKEGIERVYPDIREYINSNMVGWSNFDLSGSSSNMYIDLMLSMPITLTAKGQQEISETNQNLIEEGITYQIPYSISSCTQLKSELNKALTYFKNTALNEMDFSDITAEEEVALRQAATYLLNKVYFGTVSTGNSKTAFKLYLPTKTDLEYVCNNIIIPAETPPITSDLFEACQHLDTELCQKQKKMGIINDCLNLPESFTIGFVCDGNYLYGTIDNNHLNDFIDYTSTKTGWEKYRRFYMTHLENNGRLMSSFVLDACNTDNDCATEIGETCQNFKCTTQEPCADTVWSPLASTKCSGETFTQYKCKGQPNELNQEAIGTKVCTTTTTGSGEWYTNPVIWIIVGVAFLFLMLVMKK